MSEPELQGEPALPHPWKPLRLRALARSRRLGPPGAATPIPVLDATLGP